MSYHPADRPAHHSAQPELHGDVGAEGRVQGRRAAAAAARTGAFSRCPGRNGNIGKLAAYDVQDDEGDVETRAAGAVPDGGAVDGRAAWRSWAISTAVQGGRCEERARCSGRRGWATSVQGFPVSFSVGGKQYIAVTTGLGGGSPRQVPEILAPEIHYPNSGHTLYVFALSDQK